MYVHIYDFDDSYIIPNPFKTYRSLVLNGVLPYGLKAGGWKNHAMVGDIFNPGGFPHPSPLLQRL